MSKIYYIKDENGTYLSADGRTRYTKLEGKKLYNFFKSDDAKGRKYHLEIDDEGNWLAIECDKRRDIKISNLIGTTAEKRGEEDIEITIVSVNDIASDPEEKEPDFMEIFVDEDVDVAASVMHSLELELLQKALDTLSKDEYTLIYALYLAPIKMSERELSAKIGVPQRTINYRKNVILRKLRKFF